MGGLLRLGVIGPQAQTAVPALLDALADADSDVRAYAANALGQVGPKAQAAVPRLLKLASIIKWKSFASSPPVRSG